MNKNHEMYCLLTNDAKQHQFGIIHYEMTPEKSLEEGMPILLDLYKNTILSQLSLPVI